MDTNTRWKYILLGAGAFVVVIVIVYLRVATYYKIPLGSFTLPPKDTQHLLPFTPGVKPTSVELYTSPRGVISYVVRGKFVTIPAYEPKTVRGYIVEVLRSDFVIDEDPSSHNIPVVMYFTMYIGRFTGSLHGTAVWKREDIETIRQSIKVNAPAQLRLVPNSSAPAGYDLSVQQTMESIMAGNWSLPDNFVLHPLLVGVVE